MQEPYKHKGLWYYPELPDYMRLATIEDFVDFRGKAIVGVKFLVIEDSTGQYEAHIISHSDDLHRWIEYIFVNRIYVKK